MIPHFGDTEKHSFYYSKRSLAQTIDQYNYSVISLDQLYWLVQFGRLLAENIDRVQFPKICFEHK
jgi:hypothetical protein